MEGPVGIKGAATRIQREWTAQQTDRETTQKALHGGGRGMVFQLLLLISVKA